KLQQRQHECVITHTHTHTDWCRSEEHTSELQSHLNLVCRLLLEKQTNTHSYTPPRRPTHAHTHTATHKNTRVTTYLHTHSHSPTHQHTDTLTHTHIFLNNPATTETHPLPHHTPLPT